MNNYRRLVSARTAPLLVMVIILVGGLRLTAAFAQDALKFTGCVNRKGKIKFLAEGEAPLKSCKTKQIQIMFPSTLKTLQLQSVPPVTTASAAVTKTPSGTWGRS